MTAVVVLAAACGSSGGSNTTSVGGGAPKQGSQSTVVETHSGPLGTYLTDGSGKSLYMFASDSSKKSTCTAACATYWPPLTTKSVASASGNVTGNLLSTITRSDGVKQVVYDGHPLYYFVQDTSAGDTKGQGSNNFGAKWWLLAPSGRPVTAAAGGSTSTTTSGESSGGGWS